MRLRRLDLTRYGRFTDGRLDFGPATPGAADFHIVYGLNEAGKSTSLSGFLDLLFGIEQKSRYDFLHPYSAMEVGALLEIDGAEHHLIRRKQRAGSLTDGAGQAVNEALLAGALGGLSRESYRAMFSLDDETLEAGGEAILQSRGDLGELLFSARRRYMTSASAPRRWTPRAGRSTRPLRNTIPWPRTLPRRAKVTRR